MNGSPHISRFPSRRSAVLAKNGLVATSQPLAAQAGLSVLQAGGNAVDAAVVTAMVLTVVEPMSTGAGGDAFALIRWNNEGSVRALNGSGRAPSSANITALTAKGQTSIPPLSPLAVTVPGAVDAWHQLLQEYGTLSWAEALAPAIEYAEKGFPVSPVIASQWAAAEEKLRQNREAMRVYLPAGRPPHVGELFRQPDLARTYRLLADEGPSAFYQGALASAIAEHVQSLGGWIEERDMWAHRTTWERPISLDYGGVTIYEHPPNGQGLVALIALNLLSSSGFPPDAWGSVETVHQMAECMKLAFVDGHRYVADPAMARVPVSGLLSPAYAAERSSLIASDRAIAHPQPGIPPRGDTVYLSVVDGERNAVSFINSIFHSFGAGIVVPGTGICLHNRGCLFSLDPDSPNALAPHKRPYHTIIPAMACRQGRLWLSFGVMGGFMQPQGHVQVVTNLLDFGMSYQEAMDAPRWRVDEDGAGISLEPGFPRGTRAGLRQKGHRLQPAAPPFSDGFGGGQIIALDPQEGTLWGASDPRKDGCAIGW